MARHRHSDENRVAYGSVPAKALCTVEALRRRATLRKLVLLECAIIRHAPFAGCGRPIWDLLPRQKWFERSLWEAEFYRLYRSPESRESTRDRQWALIKMNGHDAIGWFEQYGEGTATDDQLILAQEYFSSAEYAAEADRFDTPEEQRTELEISYGIADWLPGIGWCQPEQFANVLDYYLAKFSGEFYVWGGYRPFHPGHRPAVLELIDDIFGPPLLSPGFDPAWRTSETLHLAAGMYESRDYSPAPILADALEDAGCDHAELLAHCRAGRRHVRGCWAVDRVLGKQ